MKSSHWVLVGLTVLSVGGAVVAQYYPQYGNVCHAVSAVAAAVAGALGLTTPSINEKATS